MKSFVPNVSKPVSKSTVADNVIPNPDIIFGEQFFIDKNVKQNQPFSIKLQDMNHLVISGLSGTGKSAIAQNIIYQAMAKSSPEYNKFFIINSSGLDYFKFESNEFLPLGITSEKEALNVVSFLNSIQDKRIDLLKSHRERTIGEYNNSYKAQIPHLFLIIDSYRELYHKMDRGAFYKFENGIDRLLPLGKKLGVHLIILEQLPDGGRLPYSLLRGSDRLRGTISKAGLIVEDRTPLLLENFKCHDFLYEDSNREITRFRNQLLSQEEAKGILSNVSKKYSLEELGEVDSFSFQNYIEQSLINNQI